MWRAYLWKVIPSQPTAPASSRKGGVIAKDDPCRFGFHNLRHSLASFLVRTKTDPKTVQALLRHSDVKTTLQLYATQRQRGPDDGGG